MDIQPAMVFVTGATGFTGPYVVEALLAAGESVRCLVRETSQADFLVQRNIPIVEGDLERPDGLVEAIQGADALVSVSPIRFAPSLVAACQQAGVTRGVFLSSTWRFSKVRTPDVEAVSSGEEAVEASGMEATILRPTMIYGPGNDRNLSLLRDYLGKRSILPIFGSGENLVQPVYVTDVADAVVAALLRSGTIGQVYELAGGEPLAYTAMVDTLSHLMGRTVVKVYVPLFVAVPLIGLYGKWTRNPAVRVDQVKRMAEDRAFDISRAEKDLGFAPKSFSVGMREAMQINGEL